MISTLDSVTRPTLKAEGISFEHSPEFRLLIEQSTAYCRHSHEESVFTRYPYAFITYVDDSPKKFISCTLRQTAEFIERQSILDLLRLERPEELHDLLFIATYYDPLGLLECEWGVKPVFPRTLPKPDPLLDQLLHDCRGMIAYNHQVELLYRTITGCSEEISREFRKAISAKKDWAWAEAEILRFVNGLSLADILRERMVYSFTLPPNYIGAANLFDWCRQQCRLE